MRNGHLGHLIPILCLLTTASVQAASSSANQAPQVVLTSPSQSLVLTAPAELPLAATASDSDGTIKRVDFYQGSSRIGSVSTAPYTFTWSRIRAGSYNVTARAIDNQGAVAVSQSLALRVNAPPSISLLSPKNNAVVVAPGQVALTVDASDSDGQVAAVDYLANGNVIATQTSAPYNVDWNNIPAGIYTLTARVTDNDGASTLSKAITLKVDALASVALTEPADGTLRVAPASLTLKASAADNDGGVKRVDFYQGTRRLGSVTTPPYEFTWNRIPAGDYQLTARAVDSYGKVSTSAPVRLLVDAPPKVQLIAPKTSTRLYAPATFSLLAKASDTDNAVTQVAFYQGDTLLGSSTTANANGYYEFVWANVAAGAYDLSVVATDSQGITSRSRVTSITVDAPPTIYLDQLNDGTWITQVATVPLTAVAADTDGTLRRVEFFANGNKIGNGVAGTPTAQGSPYTFPWKKPALGTYVLTARATDNRGASTDSPAVQVKVRSTTNQPPSIALSSDSLLDATPPGNFTLTAQASDSDGNIAQVAFYQGNTLLGQVVDAPYLWAWEGVTPGSYTLTAKATDDRGSVSTSAPITVRVNQPPTVSLTAPADNLLLTVPSDLTLTAQAGDADGTVARVDFYNGTQLLGSAANVPYSLTLSNAAAGSYNLTAVAIDNDGASTASNIVGVTVDAPPTISLTLDQASLVAPGSVLLNAQAGDSDGTVTRVDFYNGSLLLGSQSQAPFTYLWQGLAVGSYTVTAVATDDKGVSTASTAQTLTVVPNQAPTIRLTAPADGLKQSGPATITLTAEANDVDGRVTQVAFYQGGTLLETVTQAPYRSTWSNVAVGSYTLTAVATDDKGASSTSSPVGISVTAAQAKGVFYILPDHLGTPRAVTNEQNTVVWKNDPLGDPFGNAAPEEDPDEDGQKFTLNLRFPGQYFDVETNTHYNYFRDYDPVTGRYVQSDPIGLKGGENTYLYVNGNPISVIDLQGLMGRGPGKGAYPLGQGPGASLGDIANNMKGMGPFGPICGSGPTASWIPDGLWGDACRKHDDCYSKCGANKQVCDLNFLKQSGNIFYYVAVTLYGSGPFQDAQKACSCSGGQQQ